MRSFSQKLRKKFAGFTIVEIAIFVVIVVILIGMSLALYRRIVTRSEDTEAVVNLEAIRKAEEVVLVEEGTYVNASDTEEIEERLEVDLTEKIFTYRVEEATDDNYVAIAERKDPVADETLIIALGPAGAPMYYFGSGESGGLGGERTPWQGPESLYPGGSSGGLGGSSGVDTGSISDGSAWGGLGGGDISSSSGSSSSGSSGGSSGTVEGVDDLPGPIAEESEEPSGGATGVVCGDGVCTGTESCVSCAADCGECPEGGGAIVDAALMDAYNSLKNSSTGGSLGALLDNYNVIVALGNASMYGAIAYWSPTENTIVVDSGYAAAWTTGAIAAMIAHEATHADFTYNPDSWITETLTRHPELSESDLHIDQSDPAQYPWDSIDQEYNAFQKQAEVWDELKDATNAELDYVSWLLAQGEAVAKVRIREVYGPLGLPEY